MRGDDAERIDWIEPLSRFQSLVQQPGAVISFDVSKLDAAMYSDEVFGHIEAVLEHEAEMDLDGRRYVPRLMMALVMMLHDRAQAA